VGADGTLTDVPREAAPFLDELEAELVARASSNAKASYTKSLLDGGAPKIRAKILEEAAEFADTLEHETDERVASEAADLIYHALVGLRLRGVSLRRVIEVLSARSGTSGHDEKAQRGLKLS
jgi:phosphoribosyl-ATP pyrophosphohydrolase/phosphoribosyl-AMP cyclohydrolase